MEIRMYECGFGDCFRLREASQVDLYVDFGIHSSSWAGKDKIKRFDNVIADMNEKKDFLLTHYHDDHFNGAIYMAATTTHRFKEVYISDVWNMPGSVYVTLLTLLRGIFTKSVILGENTALWPEKNYVARKAQRMFEKLQVEVGKSNLEEIERIANRLNEIVIDLANDNDGISKNYEVQFNELRKEYLAVQKMFDNLHGDNGPMSRFSTS